MLNTTVMQNSDMKKITLSLSDKTEAELRRIAEDQYGGMKGALSMIAEQALQEHFKKLGAS